MHRDVCTCVFQVITPCRRLILCADNRKEMEEWMTALRSIQNRQNYEVSLVPAIPVYRDWSLYSLLTVCVCPSPPSIAWTTSVGCTTGTPAPTPDPRTATCAGRLCQGSRHTASPVKVHTHTHTHGAEQRAVIVAVRSAVCEQQRVPDQQTWS